MQRTLITFTLVLASAALFAQAPAPATVTVIRAARMIDGRGGAVVSPATIVIRGNKIEAGGANVTVPAARRSSTSAT